MIALLAKLLVVDDSKDNRDLLTRRLERADFHVQTASDGEEALALIQKHSFDLVVLDLLMPGMSGMQVLGKIRESKSKLELPVLIATAQSDSEDVVRALELGANDYVTKPIDFPVVKARIESHLQLRTQMESMAPPKATFYSDGTADPGTLIDDRYEVLATIGRGGFAVVFKARQLSTGQVVALKVMQPHRVSDRGVAPTELARFNREMDLIGRLNHPNIIGLIDSGSLEVRVAPMEKENGEGEAVEIPNTQIYDKIWTRQSSSPRRTHNVPTSVYERTVPYIVMEFSDGQPMSTLIANEAPLAPGRVVELMLPVISAVAMAHQAGVIHRDLKPPNILVAHRHGRPHPKVLDFGIAKLIGEESVDLTADAQLLGTPQYMSSEQAQGQTDLDGRCDQYTIAVMMYEAVTGQRPFQSESFMKLVHMISAGDCKPPSEVLHDVPPDFGDVIMRAMSVEPSSRYSSLETFGRALLAFASNDVRAQWEPYFTVPSDPPPPLNADDSDGNVWQTEIYSGERTISSRQPLPNDLVPRSKNKIWPALAAGFVFGFFFAWVVFRLWS